jgi:hypothetical protein
MAEPIQVNKNFIINFQGSEFITFEGLLDLFHQNGGTEIKTEIINTTPLIFQATVKGKKGIYQGVGDADDNNVGKMIARHKIRMAETRAIARALRWYNNIGMCSNTEIAGEELKENKVVNTNKIVNNNKVACSNCKEIIDSQKVIDYSKEHYQKVLCFKCQPKKAKPAQTQSEKDYEDLFY